MSKKQTYQAKYYQSHKEQIAINRRRWYDSPGVREQQNAYHLKRYHNDPQTKFSQNHKNMVRKIIQNIRIGKYYCQNVLGVKDRDTFMTYLKSTIPSGYTLSDYGNRLNNLTIDHIRPLSSFNLSDPVERAKCFNYKNLRLIPFFENLARTKK